jgi:hydrophobic W protein
VTQVYVDAIPPGTPLVPVTGFNSLTLEARSMGIIAPSQADTSDQTGISSSGQDVTYYQKEIQTYSELRTWLKVSASASFLSAGGATSFCYERTVTSYSLFLLVKCDVLNDTQTYNRHEFNARCAEIAGQSSPSDFLAVYGDEFVVSRVTGGILVALYQFDFQSDAQRQTVSAQISASGEMFSSGADWEQGFSKIDRSSVTHVFFHRHGGSGPLPAPGNFVQYALAFPDAVANPTPSNPNGAPLTTLFVTAPYSEVTNKPTPCILPNLLVAKQEIGNLAELRDEALKLLNEIAYAIQYSWQFQPFDSPALLRSQKLLTQYKLRVETAAETCFADPLNVTHFSQPVPDVTLPVRKLPNIAFTFLLHIAAVGDTVYPGNSVGGIGNNQIEGFQLDFLQDYSGFGCEYLVHMADIGDGSWIQAGKFAGTRGESRNIQGIAIRLTGPAKDNYSIWYRGQRGFFVGRVDLAPVKDGAFLGTRGQYSPLLQLEVHIVPASNVFVTPKVLEQLLKRQHQQERRLKESQRKRRHPDSRGKARPKRKHGTRSKPKPQ